MSDYLSVTEYAKLNGKDPGNIRRMLISGRMEGQKVGNQWIIPKDTRYPDDRRETSGNYHRWRNRTVLNKNRELMKSVKDLVKSLCSIYGDTLSEIVLYGSYARGTQTEESDVDIAVILSEKPTKKITDEMIDSVAIHELECGKVLSVIDINKARYDEWQNALPFYRNIKKEGIVLWKKTA